MGKKPASEEPDREELLKTIGQSKVENDSLKKDLACSVEQKKVLINPEHATLSVSRQCKLLELPRSTYTFQPADKTSRNLESMVRLDEEYSRHPFYGYRKMTEYLNECGYQINRQRVSRLMGELGLRMIYPGPKLSAPGKDSKKYPYLLRDLEVTCPNQVWVIKRRKRYIEKCLA